MKYQLTVETREGTENISCDNFYISEGNLILENKEHSELNIESYNIIRVFASGYWFDLTAGKW